MSTKQKDYSFMDMSRRRFLGMAAVAGLTTACSAGADDSGYIIPPEMPFREGKWLKSFCGSCIWTNCGTEVKIVDGVAVEIKGNRAHPSNKGTLCPRGSAQLMNLYNPYRLKRPLKRTNHEKGLNVDPGWVEISWKEAMDTVVQKVKEARDKDPRKVMMMYGFAANLHESPFIKLFTAIMGTPNYAMSCGPLCEVHHAPALYNATFVDRIDMSRCNYVIAFGRNIGTSAMFASGPGRALADGIERGMKVVSVDPHAGPDVKNGEWVPIRPGTDVAMAMAMMHVILHEDKIYDIDAVQNRSNAPYLIDEQGDYIRGTTPFDITPTYAFPHPNADSQGKVYKPLMWDIISNSAKDFDDPTINSSYGDNDANYDDASGYTVNGVKARPAFMALKESVKINTPEWAENITGVAAATIRRITKELVAAACIGETIELDGEVFPLRPVAVTSGRGSANNMQGMRFYIYADMINLLLGAIGVPGSLICAAGPRHVSEDGMMREYPLAKYTTEKAANFTTAKFDYTCRQFYPLARFPILGASMGALINPEKYHLDHTVDVFFPYGANPFINDADPTMTEEAFRKVPFVFTVGYHIDETAMFCDILLPEHSHYERTQIRPIEETMVVGTDSIQLKGINYKEPVVNYLYDTRQYDDVFIELTDRLGLTVARNMNFNGFYGLMGTPYALDSATKYTYREMLDHRLQGFTKDASKGVDWFKENGFFMSNLRLRDCYEYYSFKSLGGRRLPLYNWRDKTAGDFLKSNLQNFKGGIAIPGWEGKMQDVFNEYSPVPVWHENFLTTPSAEFDMTVANWKISLRSLGLGGQDDNVWLREMVEQLEFDNLFIQINPSTAATKGLRNGDKVIITSQHGGEVEGILKVTGLMHPEVLGFPAQAGRVCKMMNPIALKGTNYNKLLTYKEGYFMGDNGSISVSARVKIRKA